MIVLLVLAALTVAGLEFRNLHPALLNNGLSAWEEYCTVAYISPGIPSSGSVCARSVAPINLPTSFNMSSIAQNREGGSLSTYYFGIALAANNSVRVSMNSSAPLDFHIFLDNRTGYDTSTLSSEVQSYARILVNSTGITKYDRQLLSEGGGLYIFELSVEEPTPVATAAFDVQHVMG